MKKGANQHGFGKKLADGINTSFCFAILSRLMEHKFS